MALDFPSSPSVGDVYTSSGISYTWDGDTWRALGAGATVGASTLGALTDVDLTNPTPNSGDYLQYVNGNWYPGKTYISGAGDIDISTPPTNGQALVWDGTSAVWKPGTVSSGVTGLSARQIASAATASIADGTSDNITITAGKTYVLHKIYVSAAAWVTLYTDQSSRTFDSSRTELQDPASGSGVVAEIITSGQGTILITPGTIGFNDDSPASSNVYLKVVNKSGSTQSITVQLTFVELEA